MPKVIQHYADQLSSNQPKRQKCVIRCIASMSKFSIWRYMASLALSSIISLNTFSQSVNSPTKTQCKQWDDAYLATFNIAFLSLPFIIILFCIILPPLFGRLFWFVTSPYHRILVITLGFFIMFFSFVVLWPKVFGFGNFFGTDPRYINCEAMQFGAEGLFGGLLGRGVPAVAQFFLETILLFITSIIGGLVAVLLSFIFNRFIIGLPSLVKGDTA